MKDKKIVDIGIIKTIHNLKNIKVDTVKVNGCKINTLDDRYENFYQHGFKCANCGIEATFGRLERFSISTAWLINFYGIDKDNNEILLTKDHIYPRSLGGLDEIHNYQVLCTKCNSLKGCSTQMSQEEALEKGYTTTERINIFSEYHKMLDKTKNLENEYKEQQKNTIKYYEEHKDILKRKKM